MLFITTKAQSLIQPNTRYFCFILKFARSKI